MPDASHTSDPERATEVDTTPASDERQPDDARAAAPAAAEGGVGDMALQTKSVVGKSDDPAEREADATAQRVMRLEEPPKPADAPAASAGASAVPETGVVQRRTAEGGGDAGGSALPDSVQAYLDESKGGGRPLPEASRHFFESRLGADLGDVRVHDDPGANEAARAIGAAAFTRNSDVYFAAGAYDPSSPSGQEIIAHELAHVLQQTGRPAAGPAAEPAAAPAGEAAITPDEPGVVRRQDDKKKKDEAAGPKGPKHSGVVGAVDTTTTPKKTLEIFKLKMPAFKAAFVKSELTVRPSGEKRSTKQIDVWEELVAGPVQTNVSSHITNLTQGKNLAENKAPTYYLQYGKQKNDKRYIIGSVDDIAKAVRRPRWDKEKKHTLFDVDHKIEYQLGGDDKSPEGNLWLLQAHANRSAGSTIRANIEKAITAVVKEAKDKVDPKLPSVSEIRSSWLVKVKAAEADGGPASPPGWEQSDMDKPAVTAPLELVPEAEVVKVKGKPDAMAIYTKPYGGERKIVDPNNLGKWGNGKAFEITSVVSAGENKGGTVSGTLFPGHKRVKEGPFTAPLKPIEGVAYGGYLDAKYATRNLLFDGLSPLQLEDAEFNPDKGLIGSARIPTPSVPALKNVEIGVRLDGEDVQAYALITGGALEVPGPFKITGGAVELTAGLEGFGVNGFIFFEIQSLASGRIGGRATTNKPGFELEGELDFDTKLFDEAKATVAYKGEKWSGAGTLRLGPGKIAGVKSASAEVKVDDKTISAEGSLESSLKGVEKGTLSFKYDERTGIEIGGKLTLGKIPGVKGGTIEAKVAQKEDGYSLSGAVSAEPAIPGVTGSITGRYDDGAFLAEANLAYAKGMLKGKVQLGLTNQSVGPDGKPAGAATDDMIVYGGGEVTIKIAPWLQGTIGIRLQPNGEMIVMGKVGLPSSIELFPEKKVEKNIFTVGIDIPIVGVAVLGQRIGIFATIKGGLDASAGFGPGVLRALELGVTYNPDREADTVVTGKAELFVPAAAGLKLFVRGGLGAGIPIVSAEAGIEVSGALGLEGAAKANVDVAWTPAKGVVLDAKGEVFVEPKFKFAIEGYVDVSADLFIETIELYKKKWSFASFEYGSNLRFGVTFPVHYEEGKDFELGLDQVQFTYPTIDTNELLRGLLARIA